MNVNFTARHTVLTPEIEQYCQKRLRALEKLLGSVLEVDVILSSQKNRHKAEINVKAKGQSLVVTEETLDMLNSLNLAFDSLEKKVKKEREKFREKKRRGGRERKNLEFAPETPKEEKKVIRSRNYSAKPMTLEEAVYQFDLQNKEAFAYRAEGTEKWAVIYRRKDGHYGLIELD